MSHCSAIGIDLGTSYSCVGVWDDGKGRVDIIPNDHGNRTTPTYVAFSGGHERLTGDSAKNQAIFNPRNTVFHVKRLLGRKFDSMEVQSDLKSLPFEVFRKGEMCYIRVEHQGVVKELSPEEISSMVLFKMKEAAEAYLGNTVNTAVVSVPAHFNHCQRQATRDAGTIAGLNVRLLDEPVAAAISICLDNRDVERNLLICDFGGGTFDVSIITLDEGIVEVKATAGDGNLGGIDFDDRLVDHFMEEFKRKFQKDISVDPRAVQRLRAACERAKRMLSSSTNTSIEIDSLFEGIDFYTSLTRAHFEELCQGLFRSTLEPIEKVLRDSKIDKMLIDEIVLIGGSSQMPGFVKLVSSFFLGKESNKGVNPDEAVACGAAIQAAMSVGGVSEKLQDFLLLETTPHSLGIEGNDGMMSVLVNRNTTIPTKKSNIFSTYFDNQPDFPVRVYEGESDRVQDNNLIGELKLSDLSPAPHGTPQIEIIFDIDSRHSISVSVLDQTTGRSERVTIFNENCLSTEEIERLTREAQIYNASAGRNVVDPDAKDVLIAVMGPTGAGKSTLINLATQSDQKLAESGDEDSCTSTVDPAPPFEQDGRRVILYDTPGFDDSRMSDTQVLQIILKELEAQYRKGITLHGIIYLHPIDQPRISGKARANFTLMQKICGDTTLKNVVVVTNRWGRLTDAERQAKWEKLLSPGSFLANAVEKKAQLAHNIEHTVDSVRGIIDKIIQNHPMPLLAQTELVDEKKTFGETSAGKESDKRLVELQEKHKKEMAEQLEQAEEAKRERDAETEREMRKAAADHQKEIDRLADERRNADRDYAARLARAEAETQAARVVAAREAAAREAAVREAATRAPAPAPRVFRSSSPRPATLQSITSGKKHTICSVKHGRYVTCEDDERSVSGRGETGFGRRWIFRQVSSGNWVIESSRYDRYLSTNNDGDVRARSQPEEWKIKTISGEYGQFRLYNTAYVTDMVLALDNKSIGTPISLVDRKGRTDELWEIDEI